MNKVSLLLLLLVTHYLLIDPIALSLALAFKRRQEEDKPTAVLTSKCIPYSDAETAIYSKIMS